MEKKFSIQILLLFLCLSQCLAVGKNIQPVERHVGKLQISIDPRIELLTTVQLLSNYHVINREMSYSKDIMTYFKSFSLQKAVGMTDSLLQKYGFSYDAPVTFMLYLSQVPELKTQIPFSKYLLERSGEGNNLEQYRKSIKQFAETSDFETFWKSKIPFYNQILDMTIADIKQKDFVKVLETYFNETQGSYNIVIAPAFMGGYGPKIPDGKGKYNIYACLSVTSMKDDIPYLNEESLIYYVWHEFSHSFVNPLTDKYADRVLASNELFEPIKDKMSKQAYTNWKTCVNEHIIRAINIRLIEMNLDSQNHEMLLNNELKNYFIYIEPLIEKLKDFEKKRDKDHITFSEFYPELLNLLDSLQKIEYWKQVKINFAGPLNEVVMETKTAWIYPTYDSDTEVLKIAQNYVLQIYNRFAKARGGILLADSVALKTDLSEYGIMAYGTIESNLFLKKYALDFPFRIKNQTIYADKQYTDKDIKFITCVPNPYNPAKGMSIYTALSNKSIQDINSVFHGGEDYILFLNRDTIIKKGFYKKKEKWTF